MFERCAQICKSKRKGVVVAKKALTGLFLTISLAYIVFLCQVANHQTILANTVLCQIAQFSDLVMFGDSADNWAGTLNLTEGIIDIEEETDLIYSSYQDIFYSGKQDWDWLGKYTLDLTN